MSLFPDWSQFIILSTVTIRLCTVGLIIKETKVTYDIPSQAVSSPDHVLSTRQIFTPEPTRRYPREHLYVQLVPTRRSVMLQLPYSATAFGTLDCSQTIPELKMSMKNLKFEFWIRKTLGHIEWSLLRKKEIFQHWFRIWAKRDFLPQYEI
jgi:hypothetical protein